ncbi:MAG: hypothetical protein IT342_24680 [Candidatus Melainabacteria bacterium]|nr:hypothetical protein [Candidatus Melainabacteria bacterium]
MHRAYEHLVIMISSSSVSLLIAAAAIALPANRTALAQRLPLCIITQPVSRPDLDRIEREYLNSFKFQRCTEGLKLVEKILKRAPQDSNAWFIKGLAYHRRAYASDRCYRTSFQAAAEYRQALLCYNTAWRCGYRTAQLYYHRGETRLNLNNPKSALDDLNRSISMDPAKDWVLATRAMAYLQLGDRQRAQSDLMKAISINPTRPANYEKLAALDFELGDMYGAYSAISHAVSMAPMSLSLRNMRARLALLLKKEDIVAQDVAFILAQDPTNATALKLRAALCMKDDQPEQAIADLLFADQINRSISASVEKNAVLSAVDVSNLLAKTRDKYLMRKLKDSAQYSYELGLLEWGLGHWMQASENFEKLLQMTKSRSATEMNSVALCVLALESLGQNDRARVVLVKFRPAAADHSLRAEIVRFLSGDELSAIIDKLADDSDKKTLANFFIGSKLARQGKTEEAEKRLKAVKDKGNSETDEYLLAIMELDRLAHRRHHHVK